MARKSDEIYANLRLLQSVTKIVKLDVNLGNKFVVPMQLCCRFNEDYDNRMI